MRRRRAEAPGDTEDRTVGSSAASSSGAHKRCLQCYTAAQRSLRSQLPWKGKSAVLSGRSQVRMTAFLACVLGGVVACPQDRASGDQRFQALKDQNELRLEIYKLTPVSDILLSACKESNVACTGLELLSKDSVPPMVVGGAFLQVVRQLIEGMEINFEYTHGTAQSRPKLAFLRRSSSVSVPAQTASAPANDSVTPLLQTTMALPTGAATGTVAPTANSTLVSTEETSSSSAAAQQTELLKAAMQMYAGGYATAATPSEFLPFPGPDGKPIPAKPVNTDYLPFPDQFGRPIPVTPAKPGSPFPPASETQAHN
jgi:hypothetical protein